MIGLWLLACGPKIDPGPAAALAALEPAPLVVMPVAGAPDLYLQAMIRAGSAFDPTGKEGLADLMARSLVEAGAGDRSSEEVDAALWPTANGFRVIVEREWVQLRLRCHHDQAALCAELFTDALVAPRFDEADVLRLRDRAVSAVTDGMLADEERMGREVLEATLYEGHPYGHPTRGRSGALEVIGVDDLAAFHRTHVVRSAVFVGLAGAVDDAIVADVSERLLALPQTMAPDLPLQAPVSGDGPRLVAVDTATPVTGLWLGTPIDLDRNDEDWPAVWLATMALGAHRSSWGRLFRTLRADRGLNYGDYAYVEPWLERGSSTWQDQGTLRTQNRFAVWIRPTSVENGPFALRLALDELARWRDEGLTDAELEDARSFLRSTIPVLAADPGRRLTYALEARATGTPDLQEDLGARLDALTLDQVNDAVRRHVSLDALTVVAVSGEAQAFVDAVTGDAPTPMTPPSPDPSLAERDAAVAGRPTGIDVAHAWVVQADGIFR
ncbi:MAG: insulinase family protein [Myxococcales bacterium]|nr:insulinase family protein [Myxococcales bacterium]